MPVTLTVPDDLEPRLRSLADAQRRPAEEVAIELLRAALLDGPPALEAAVAALRATASNPAALRPARGALRDALPAGEADGSLDLAAWEAAWAAAEAELDALTHADERADRRR